MAGAPVVFRPLVGGGAGGAGEANGGDGVSASQDPNQAAAAAAPSATAGGPDIDAWARGVLESLGVSPNARGTGGSALSIPIDLPYRTRRGEAAAEPIDVDLDDLDDDEPHGYAKTRALAPSKVAKVSFGADHPAHGGRPPRRPPSRRDSLVRREALLKGKEGSRQRRRWENDRLLHVPNAQPPLPSDWQVRPTHPVHDHVPYQVAQVWDRGLRQLVNERRAAAAVRRRKQIVAQQSGIVVVDEKAKTKTRSTVGVVTRDLRTAAKKTPAVKKWLRALEEPVRDFVLAVQAEYKVDVDVDVNVDGTVDMQLVNADNETPFYSDDDEDEIVFVGRRTMAADREAANAQQTQAKTQTQTANEWSHQEVHFEKIGGGIVFDELGDDSTSSFKRWLAHCIADYYGLASVSDTVEHIPHRVVYVTLHEDVVGSDFESIPRPMWQLF